MSQGFSPEGSERNDATDPVHATLRLLTTGADDDLPIRVDGGHTGEEAPVAAQGPGAERVRGFFPNTPWFHIMMAAYGWK